MGPGAALEQFCLEQDEDDSSIVDELELPSPQPMVRSRLAFSFSGLHSQFDVWIHARGGIQNIDMPTRRALARRFQSAAVKQLEDKLELGLSMLKEEEKARLKQLGEGSKVVRAPVNALVVSGGVASNLYLRQRHVIICCICFLCLLAPVSRLQQCLKRHGGIPFVAPPQALCTGRFSSLRRLISDLLILLHKTMQR